MLLAMNHDYCTTVMASSLVLLLLAKLNAPSILHGQIITKK